MSKALIVVDVQNDFITGSLPVQDGAQVARRLADLIKLNQITKTYDYVVTTQDWHYMPKGHWSDDPDYVDTWPVHCKAGTEGAALHDDVKALRVDERFLKGLYKAAYSGFEGSGIYTNHDLSRWLDDNDVSEVDVVGLAFDYCVKATALDAVKAGYKTRVLTPYTGSVNSESHELARDEMLVAGVTVEDVI